MLESNKIRNVYIEKKENRRKIYETIFAFVELSDDYWISFKKLRKVLKNTDDLEVFFATFISKDGKFIPAKLEKFIAILDKKYEIIMEEQRKKEAEVVVMPKSEKKKKDRDNAIKVFRPAITKSYIIKNKDLDESNVTIEGDTSSRKRIRRVRLTEEQLKELEKLRKEKNK